MDSKTLGSLMTTDCAVPLVMHREYQQSHSERQKEPLHVGDTAVKPLLSQDKAIASPVQTAIICFIYIHYYLTQNFHFSPFIMRVSSHFADLWHREEQ